MRRCSTSTRIPTTTARSSRSRDQMRARRGARRRHRVRARAHRPAPARRRPSTRGRGGRRARRRRLARAARSGEAGRAALADRVGAELGLPVFLYGELAPGVRPALLRRGGPAELQRRIDAGELTPDRGPARLDPTAGCVLVGARRPLIAFNVNLATDDLRRRAVDRGRRPRDGRRLPRASARSASRSPAAGSSRCR